MANVVIGFEITIGVALGVLTALCAFILIGIVAGILEGEKNE